MPHAIHIGGDTVDVLLRQVRPTSGPPVVYVPGLGANARSFDLVAERSLASHLHGLGFTPWSVDFDVAWRNRGQCGTSLLAALRSAMDELAKQTEGHQVRAIGHSLGGILLLGLAVEGARFHRLVTLGTGLDYRLGHVDLKHLLRFMRVPGRLHARWMGRGGFPLKTPAQVISPLFGRGLAVPLQVDQFHPGTTDGPTIRRFFREGVRDIPFPLLMDLAGLFQSKGLRFGSDPRPLKDRVRQLDQPILLVGGRQDRQCPVASVVDAAERVPAAQLLEVGDPGKGAGYGHMDLLLAPTAPGLVFEPIGAFLA